MELELNDTMPLKSKNLLNTGTKGIDGIINSHSWEDCLITLGIARDTKRSRFI